MIGIPLFKGSRSMSFVARRNRRLLRCLYDSWFFREFFRTVESCFWIVSLWILSGEIARLSEESEIEPDWWWLRKRQQAMLRK
ncbi:MAG: hypothetical protein EOR72_21835 [Mesorhizobium sp.]|uniref:hypothetical protein n=1 Tax=Mesorhizobium sp. TaxID=1871066 RepID=UPI000FE72E5A|nr:hypothetical protein [Mesorhizobium sp.]RWM12276.1 MAG: hypothetical protein EOR72_21835 [Mesorhizobium sp.]